ncbi:hypothetical protein EKO04_004122 [Ascochyta lentis]|uniref:non-specific serine/threonine protein kinase n=1 Tax=Ascochyta lentis TaxID=205686 RepID=A0A8H7J5K6_9PLEO|nr:hypothetical protein EKO04_004122 [Ascochyta lentis]
MSDPYDSGSNSLPSPLRSPAKSLSCPYSPGATFIAYRHLPPAPFGGSYTKCDRPNQRDLKRTTQLDWCVAHPPTAGITFSDDSHSFNITSIIRGGEDCGAQIVLSNTGLVAKIYDPLFYSFQNQEFSEFNVDVTTAADSEYSIEAAAYSKLQQTPVEGSITPQYYGSWTIDIASNVQGEYITREVRMILVEHVPGVRMVDIDPDLLTPELREHVMIRVIEADYDLRRAGVRHDDLAPRNIILSEKPDTIDPNIRVTLVDFGHSIVYDIRYGRPLRWEVCNPLFNWASASTWSFMGWLPSFSEESVNSRWELWGDGRNGKYAKVERDPDSQVGKPLKPKLRGELKRNC